MMRRRGKRRGVHPLALIAVGLALAGSIAAATVLRSGAASVPPGTCAPGENGPATVVVLDASNKLAPRAEATVREVARAAAIGGRGLRVIIARVSGSRDYQPEILFHGCDPGGAGQARYDEGQATRDELRQTHFLAPLEVAIGRLVEPVPDHGQTYLAETVMRVASDPAMHLDQPGSSLIILSDLIQNVRGTSMPYRNGRIVLPPVEEPFLNGLRVTVVELPAMPGADVLQTHKMREAWRDWFKAAGAMQVTMRSPGLARRG